MAEIIGAFVLGAVVSAMVTAPLCWDRGFNKGVSWAMHRYWGRSHD